MDLGDQFLFFVMVGLAAQLIDGALGMAFGLVSSSVLLSMGVPPAAVSASVHTAEVFTTGASGVSHLVAGNVDKRLFFRLAIPGAIGGAMGVEAGVDFLCYLTPAEHLTLPDEADVRAGVMASRVAAHVGEVALGRPAAVAREAAMNAARKALDWEAMSKAALDPQMLEKRREDHKTEEVCAMCGKFCSVKMLRGH